MIAKPQSLLAIALSLFLALALSSCSSSSDDDDNPATTDNGDGGTGDGGTGSGGASSTVPAEAASGYVVDGYIRNAFVCLDIDNDNECGDDEPYSKSSGDGSYSLDVSDLSDAQKGGAQLITIGGTDNDSGYRFTGLLQAPLFTDADGNIHITPITTLLAAQVTANTADAIDQPVADLQAQLALDVDPRTDPATNNDLQKVAIQVQKSLELIAAALQVQQFGLPDEEAMDAAMQALANDLAAAAETSRNGSSIAASATSAASVVDLPKLVGAIDSVTLNDGTQITVPDNISSSAQAMAQEINDEFANATNDSDINNLIYAVALTVEELKDEIANTDSDDLASLDLENKTAIDIDDGRRVEIDRMLSLIAYEPESNGDYDHTYEYLVDKDSNNAITGSTTVAQFNDLLDGWLSADSFADGELDKLAELQQLALVVILEESSSSDSLITFDSLLGSDNGDFDLDGIRFENNDYKYPTLELRANYMPYDESTNSGEFDTPEKGFNLSSKAFDLEKSNNSEDEYEYIWDADQKTWVQVYDKSYFTLSDSTDELTILKQSVKDDSVSLDIGTIRIESEINLAKESRIFSIVHLEDATVTHEFSKGRELLLVIETNRNHIWFEEWRIGETDGTNYDNLSEFIAKCDGNLANKEQCAIDKVHSSSTDGSSVTNYLGINSAYNDSGDNYIVHLQHNQSDANNLPEVMDSKAGLYEKGYLSDNETEVIKITHIDSEYVYIYDAVDEITDEGNDGFFMMYGDQVIFALGKSLQAGPDTSVTYDKDAYEDFVEGSGAQLKAIVDSLQ